MLTHGEALTLQVITLLAVFLSPIMAVVITLWSQKRNAKRNAQMNLFMDLVSFRDHVPFPWQYSVALNRIDVVFHKQETILLRWHEYYDSLQHELKGNALVYSNEKKVALISEIAKHLGYRNIDQIFLQRYYQSKGSFDDFVNDAEIRKEFLRVLKSTETLFVLGKYEESPLEKDFKDGKIERKKLSENDEKRPEV